MLILQQEKSTSLLSGSSEVGSKPISYKRVGFTNLRQSAATDSVPIKRSKKHAAIETGDSV